MSDSVDQAILADPEFQRLARLRNRLSWTIAACAAASLVGLIAGIALAPGLLGRTLTAGSFVTLGMLAALGVVLLCVVLTGAYLRLCSQVFEPAQRRVQERIRRRD